jgi:hypothetical protein
MTFAAALPALLRLHGKSTNAYRALLGCAHSPRLHPVPDMAREVTALDWNVCPFDLLESPFLRAVETLDRLAKVAPLTGWPDRYVHWAVAGILTLRAARGEV